MWGSIRRHLSYKSIAYATVIVVVPFAIVATDALFGARWLQIALISIAIAMLGTLLTNHYIVPAPYRKLRAAIAEAERKSMQHPMLHRYYEDGIVRTKSELENISKERFSFSVSQVPDMSIHAMNLVNRQCILTFPIEQSEKLLASESGAAHRYYAAMVGASRTMQQAGLEGVIRIFILKRSEELSVRLLRFIRNNINDGIVVRLIFEDDVPTPPSELEALDFGYYETAKNEKWIMLLHRVEPTDRSDLVDYIVDTDRRRVALYLEYSKELIRKSKTFEEFMQLLVKPVNGDLWPGYFAARGFEMFPPHGLSDEDADYIVTSAVRKVSDPAAAAVLVLGFRPKLIRRLISAKVGTIVSIDQYEAKPIEFGDVVSFQTGNWLDFRSEQKFDAIIFDEAINNLSRIQLSLLFPQMARCLLPHGYLIGRVMGRFDDERTLKYLNVSSRSAVEMLRKINGQAHDDFAPLIMCLFHSRNISFSQQALFVDCDKWNSVMNDLRLDGFITDDEFRNWRLPFSFKLLSPDQDTLYREGRESNFTLRETRPVQGAYIEKTLETAGFYRIYNFEYIPTQ